MEFKEVVVPTGRISGVVEFEVTCPWCGQKDQVGARVNMANLLGSQKVRKTYVTVVPVNPKTRTVAEHECAGPRRIM